MTNRILLLCCMFLLSVAFSKRANAQGGNLPLDSTVAGTVNGADVDVWKVIVPKDGRLNIHLTSTNGTAINSTVFDDSTNYGDNGGADGLAAGIYYVHVTSYYGNQTCSYTLSVNLIPAGVPNDKETNDTYQQAVKLKLNGKTTGHIFYHYDYYTDHQDWYKIILTADGLLKLKIANNANDGHIVTCTLFDSDGVHDIGGVNASASTPSVRVFDGLAAGTYYIRIATYYDNFEFAPYTLTDSLFTYNYAADAEPDNSPYQAQTIVANKTVTGHDGFYYTYNSSDGADWWKIKYTGTGNLDLKFNLENHLSDNAINATEFRVYSDTAKDPIYFATFSNPDNTINLSNLTTGNYWILVTPSANYFGFESYSITNNAILPVTFTSFNGSLQNNSTVLNWSTANELNNTGFEVQRTNDGISFTDIGFVPAHVKSSIQNNYTYTDDKVVSGANYYRLKQIDNDGRFNYSSTIKLYYSKFAWTISGNSSNNSLLQLQLDKNANVIIQIISLSGKILQTINKGNIAAGTCTIPLNLNNRESGMYIVKLIVDGKSYSKKIMQ